MKYLVAIALLCFAVTLRAEFGELQWHLGVGISLPVHQQAVSSTASFSPQLFVPFRFLFGVSDNFDVALYGDWGMGNNIASTLSGSSMRRVEYADMMRGSVVSAVRWNVVPGYVVALHVVGGIGAYFEHYYHRAIYLDGTLLSGESPGDVSRGRFGGCIGADTVWRLPKWHLLVGGETLFHAYRDMLFFTVTVSIGFSWMSQLTDI